PLVRSFMLIISTVSSRTGRETRRSAPTTGAGYWKTPVQASRLFTWHMTPACSDWQHPVPGLGQASSRARQENRAPDFWVSYSGGIAERFPALSRASEHDPGPSGRPLTSATGVLCGSKPGMILRG